jgi:hypothetical protein
MSDEPKLKWLRTEYGTWYLPGSGYQITRETDENGRKFWLCRANGVPFDRARTLAEAKFYCQ